MERVLEKLEVGSLPLGGSIFTRAGRNRKRPEKVCWGKLLEVDGTSTCLAGDSCGIGIVVGGLTR